jgi:hypothetical protein
VDGTASNLSHSLHVKISMYILVLDDQFVLLTNMFCFVGRAESIEALIRMSNLSKLIYCVDKIMELDFFRSLS